MWRSRQDRRVIFDFTPEELAAKRARAIAEEAQRKLIKIEEFRIKNELKHIALGRAICALSPDVFGFSAETRENGRERQKIGDVNGDEVVANVAGFANGLKRLLGEPAKGTICANTRALASSLCHVNQKAVLYIDERVERAKRMREEARRRALEETRRKQETLARIDGLFIEIGRLICSLTREDVTSPSSTSSSSSSACSPDASPPRRLRARKRTVDGEDVVMNTFRFVSAVKELLGETSKATCFRGVFELSALMCNVAEKSVRDRQKRHFGERKRRRSQ